MPLPPIERPPSANLCFCVPQVEELINGMFSSSGINHKESLTYDDFKLMMREYKGDFIAIGLDCKGAKQNFLDTSTNVAR